MDYLLRTNQKRLATDSSPAAAFNSTISPTCATAFRAASFPLSISVDTKKRELIGNFKNSGRRWDASSWPVNDHDFRSTARGIGIPYGIYDPVANHVAIVLGVSHVTPAFAVHSIAHWWHREGLLSYPSAKELLIYADTGGSNGCRSHAWKTELQSQPVNPFRLKVTVAHYPTGTSKWNPHRTSPLLRNPKNWAGEPLDSYQKLLTFIRTTSTNSGLSVSACLDRRHYSTGLCPAPAQLSLLRLHPHGTLPIWNYSITRICRLILASRL
jgi:hypothetical protein